MAAFPPAYPSVPTSLDASIDSWLTLEGGSHAAENALEMVFSGELLGSSHQLQQTSGKWDNFAVEQHPQQSLNTAVFAPTGASSNVAPLTFSTPSANNGPSDNGLNKLYPFGLQFEDLWKASPPANSYIFEAGGMHNTAGEVSATTQHVGTSKSPDHPFRAQARSSEGQGETPSTASFAGTSQGPQSGTSPPTVSTSISATRDDGRGAEDPRPRPRRKVIHRGLTTDTWLNTMQMPEEGNVNLPRPDITSPEQIINELAVETSVVG